MKSQITSYEKLCDSIGYQFNQSDLLIQALTHRSASQFNNERLEFLGDGLLNLIAADLLYKKFPLAPEGDLSRMRSFCVNKDSLHLIAQHFDLKNYIKLGDGERMGGGHAKPSILADTVEALIGAIYIDSNFVLAQQTVSQWLTKFTLPHIQIEQLKDAKTILQEWLQSKRKALPTYQLMQTMGQAHEQDFFVECHIPSMSIVTHGKGKSRRAAEQSAAKLAMEKIENKNAKS